jgi:hypothetical protein
MQAFEIIYIELKFNGGQIIRLGTAFLKKL